MEIPWLLLLWTALFGAVLSYDGEDRYTMSPLEEDSQDMTTAVFEEQWVGALPGFEIKVTQHGLNYAAGIAIDTLMMKLANLSIPDMKDEIGIASVGIYNVRVVEFPRPRSALRLLPQQGLRWRAKGLSPVIKANYEALFSLGFWDVKKEGIITIEGQNLQFSLDFFVGRDLEGRPSVTVFDCNARGDISLSFEGGLSRSLNVGSRVFKRKIRNMILHQVCSNAKAEINDKTGWALSRFKLVERIPPDFEVDFSLVRFPSFKNHSVHAYHKGAFYYTPNRREPPFQPAEIPFFPRHRKKMVYVYVTSYMLNSAFYALYANNKLAINVTSNIIPPEARMYFATSCPGKICLGSLVPELSQYYPTSEIALSVYATEYPRVSIDSGHIRLTGAMAAQVYALEGNAPVRILSVAMNVTGAVKVMVANGTVRFDTTALRTRAEVEYSKMGSTNSEVFEEMVNSASHEFLLPVLKDIGGTGFTLPELEHMRLIKPEIINVDGLQDVLIIASDFEILPIDWAME